MTPPRLQHVPSPRRIVSFVEKVGALAGLGVEEDISIENAASVA